MNAPLYTAEALSTGSGRQGRVTTPDGRLGLDLAPPTELGGSGNGTNPEQLFAAGFGACFHSALHLAARMQGIHLAESSVGARVSLNREDRELTLSVLLEVLLPDIDRDLAEDLISRAEQLCPYSRATRGNIVVTVAIADD